MTTAQISERELDQARLELVRDRIVAFGVVVGLILIVLSAAQWVVSVQMLEQPIRRPEAVSMAACFAAGLAIVVMSWVRRRRAKMLTLRWLVGRTLFIVIISVLGQVGGATVLAKGLTRLIYGPDGPGQFGPGLVLPIFAMCVHSAGAMIVPWRIREAVIPPATWVALTLVGGLLSGSDSLGFIIIGVGLCLLAGLPGVAITFFRSSAIREVLGLRLIGARYAEVERELAFARRLHERLFPKPIVTGPVRLAYAYEPMRQIGGDFLDAWREPDGTLNAVLIDVTGHGVAAALAVNRLHGEIKRLVAEHRGAMPHELVAALNRYVELTLADESVFATAVAARVSPNGDTTLCIAGHPPPLVRTNAGAVRAIQPTAPLLGAVGPQEFEAGAAWLRLAPGETLVLYTDGAIECRDETGAFLGQGGLERVVAGAGQDLCTDVIRSVAARRSGPAEDDVLIAAITLG